MRTFFRDYLNPLLTAGLLAVVALDHFAPKADPTAPATVDGAKLGREYAPALTLALADAWDGAAGAIEQGQSVSDAQTALQDRFKAGRVTAFTSKVAPSFARVLPEGTEPRDAAHRAEVAALFRAFGRGLKGGK